MSEPEGRPDSRQRPPPGRSFGLSAEDYERACPSYPEDAASWLTGAGRSVILELGAGTGKLTALLHHGPSGIPHGHDILATDPLPELLSRLAERAPVRRVAATAEQIPLRSRSVDVVVCGGSFDQFDHDRALPEIARVLRPGGVLALASNTYDVQIPWVRRLKDLIAPQAGTQDEAVMPLMATPYFGFVEKRQFRFWQPHTAASLADLARSVSHVSTMKEHDRARVLAKVDELYAGFGRGHDGMQLAYVTRCYRAVVRHQELPPEPPPPTRRAATVAAEDDRPDTEHTGPVRRTPPEDPGTQLIDFR